MALPVAAAIGILETLLPIANSLVTKINLIKKENPEAWAQVRDGWKDAVSGWRDLDTE